MPTSSDRTQRFQQYVAQLAEALEHRDRHEPVRAYLTGLYLPGERKSVEPLAARVDPRRLEGYRKLVREAAHLERRQDVLARNEERRRWKVIHKSVRRHMNDRYGSDR